MPLCVYAIVGRPFSRGAPIRANGVTVRAVNARAATAVVSECKGPLSPTVRALRGHDRVVRRIAKTAPAILPVRFGTLVDSEESLIALLDRQSDALKKGLALVNRHCQMTLRLFAAPGDAGPAEGIGITKEPGPAEPVAAGGAAGPGTSYLAGRARAQAAAQSAPELDPLREVLAPIVAAERIARHDQGPLILTAYHLIPRRAVTAYRRLLRRHAAALRNRVVVSGPWPPYAFVPEMQ